ncbi:hypothetical protein C6P40_001143 [Pichia californica]|uniref:Uncharacterized protein n=1 Tax=Pichia californica TaxID=460514 RepID=A0A9P6WLL7_9ASCO|nr:hypothetical protein C6P42_004118 [[Candida] californica]KAG0688303.1 hypothetical protein C6P40_001143 [[Candida] californica]
MEKKHASIAAKYLILELQIGLLNRCFYHPCQFCEEEGGSYHTFFSCEIAKELAQQISINIPLQLIPGIQIPLNQSFTANRIIKYLIFCNKEHYKNNKLQITNNKTTMYLKFQYEL